MHAAVRARELRLGALVGGLVAVGAAAQPAPPFLEDCGLERPGDPPPAPVPTKPYEARAFVPGPPVVRRELPERPAVGGLPAARTFASGALTGKTVYLNAGHGFTWTNVSGTFTWVTQRGTTNEIVEDLVSAESISQWVLPMLLNAGARVVPIREPDLNRRMVIVDDGEAGYTEQGTGYSTSMQAGWGRPAFPMNGDVNPFASGQNRLLVATATSTATARYQAALPASGWYAVYVSYSAHTSRVTDAHYVVSHAGGDSHFRVNQRRAGGTWHLLGSFFFKEGTPARVTVHNDSSVADGTAEVSLDAVRFGGGDGVIDRGGGVSGRPRAEESSRYAGQFNGAPVSVYAPGGNAAANDRTNDISSRPRFAAWVNEPADDSVYVSWHTNAVNASARGTEVYAYGTADVNTCQIASNYAGVTGSRELADAIRREVINDIRQDAGWAEPTWRDRGTRCANFGELNPGNNGEMPATLLELAFHDQVDDAARLKEPQFRYLLARAITQGVIRYFAERGGGAPTFPPDPPTHLVAQVQPGGAVVLKLRAAPVDSQGVGGGVATGFRVYTSRDGLGFDDGVPFTGAQISLALPAGEVRFFRVTTVNAAGESLPSATVGARAPSPGRPFALVVNAFDRFDATLSGTENLSAYTLGTVRRVIWQRMNPGTTAPWGDALAANDVGFDGATLEAVLAGDVPLAGHGLIAWAAGRGHPAGAMATAAEQALLLTSQDAGTRVIYSGVGTLPSALAGPVFGVASSGAGDRAVQGAGVLMGLSLALDDGSAGGYDVGTPEGVTAQSGAAYLGNYGNSSGAGALRPQQTAYLAFPFEGITSRALRVDVLGRLLTALAPDGFDGGFPDAGPAPELDGGTDADGGSPQGEPKVVSLSPDVLMLPAAGCGCQAGGAVPLAVVVLVALRRALKRRSRLP